MAKTKQAEAALRSAGDASQVPALPASPAPSEVPLSPVRRLESFDISTPPTMPPPKARGRVPATPAPRAVKRVRSVSAHTSPASAPHETPTKKHKDR